MQTTSLVTVYKKKFADSEESVSADNSNIDGVADNIITETPITLVYNGISQLVILATPCNLEDLAIGYSLTEGIVNNISQIKNVDVSQSYEKGVLTIQINIQIDFEQQQVLQQFQNQNVIWGNKLCGLYDKAGLPNKDKQICRIADKLRIPISVFSNAIKKLQDHQHLHNLTGGAHAAVWVSKEGEIKVTREDVGRHNALDKLIGALTSSGDDFKENGFVIISSRTSCELILKAAKLGIELLAAVSAPTSLAVRYAEENNITLVGWLRGGGMSIYTNKHRILEDDT